MIVSLKHEMIQGEFLGVFFFKSFHLVATLSRFKRVSLQKVLNIEQKIFMIC